ncbi:hypothetical protein GCM10010435_12800 [Winogradskya consettensis]|uniref:Glycosyl hydrolase n=1 Tax=Winogradskya consettensis TaxID=113560 RepID=A0A919VTC7_9ACTN|nr:hypothetical protein [Actinoplanes consettensis]GIM68737.1 hypothetical protein Aco04nite_12060 [Actinoplanes consettensis]
MPTNLTASAATFDRRALPAPRAAAAPRLAPEAATLNAYAPRNVTDAALTEPVGRAYHYLDVVQDAYVKGGEPRLLQSYNNESELLTTAFVYDNALTVLAYLANPAVANVRRARLVGDALLWAQDHDETYADGRLRQAYAAGPMRFYGDDGAYFPGLKRADGKAAHLWPFGFSGSSTGDQAWAGLALAQLYVDTRIAKYLDGAIALGLWIAEQRSPYRCGGYHGGVQPDGETVQRWASTEHNIDAYALFDLLLKLTKDKTWAVRREVAATFVRTMWNRSAGHFWSGTLGGLDAEDPNEVNTGNVPEDVQAWELLGLGDPRFDTAVDWSIGNLWTTDRGISGVTYSSHARAESDAVWLEGNAHAALALRQRDKPGDAARARNLLRETVRAQESLGAGQTVGRTSDPRDGKLSQPGEGGSWTGTPLPTNGGIVAATSPLDTGFAFGYFPRQHVGTTAWFLMAAQDFNPYR